MSTTISSEDSVYQLIAEIKAQNDRAAEQLWEQYFPQLVEYARRKLASQRDPMVDGEDVALSVLDSFIDAAQEDRFPELRDRDGLWRLLSKWTYRKTIDVIRHNSRQKNRHLWESDLDAGGTERGLTRRPLENLPSGKEEPDWSLIMQEGVQELLDELGDAELQTIALKKLDRYTHKEIAAQLGCAEITIDRRVKIIRKRWKNYLE